MPENVIRQTQLDDNSKYGLSILVEALKMDCDRNLISNGLAFFKQCYISSPYPYPGDATFYEMLSRIIKTGVTDMTEVLKTAAERIRKEFIFMDMSRRIGYEFPPEQLFLLNL